MKLDLTIRDCTPYEATKIVAYLHTLPLSEPVAVEIEEKPVKEPMKYKKNPYGIPHELYTSDEKKYNRLYYRCRKHNIKYEEALKQETDEQRARTPAKPITNPDIKSTNLVIAPPKEIKHPSISVPLKIVPGVQVKQVRPDHGKTLDSVGKVVALERGGQLVSVLGSNGKLHRIDIRCLEVYVQTNGRDQE